MDEKLLGGLAGALVGVVMIYRARTTTHLARDSATWAQTPGRITTSELKWRFDTDAAGGMPDPNEAKYFAEIEYAYEVGGRAYTGSKVAFADAITTADEARRTLAAYPAGKHVVVYHDPNAPEQAVLERQEPAASAYIPGGVILIGSLIWLAYQLYTQHLR